MKTAAATELKEEAKTKEKEEEDITAHHMLQGKLKRKEKNKEKVAAATLSKEEAKMTENAPTDYALEEEVRGVKEKKIIKDNLTHSRINDHMRELNSRASAKDNDSDTIKEDSLPQKKKQRESKEKKNDRNKKKERSHSLAPESSPSILKLGQLLETGK